MVTVYPLSTKNTRFELSFGFGKLQDANTPYTYGIFYDSELSAVFP